MPIEKSAGVIVFYREPDGRIEYILIKNSANKTWGFPKGLIDKGENLQEAALREAKEEAGLENVTLYGGFKETVRYFMKVKYDYQLQQGMKLGETVLKFATYFLAEAKDKNVKLSFEHDAFEWLEFEKASERLLSGRGNTEVLKKADEFLKRI